MNKIKKIFKKVLSPAAIKRKRKVRKDLKFELLKELIADIREERRLYYCKNYPNISIKFSEVLSTKLKIEIFKHFDDGKTNDEIIDMNIGTRNKITPYRREYNKLMKDKKK